MGNDEQELKQAVRAQGRQQRKAAKAKARAPAKPRPPPIDTKRHRQIRDGLRRVRAKKRARMDEFKRKPCADCGGTFHPFVMDFDHRDDSAKTFNVSAAIPLGLPWDRVVAEIAKCDVVCANCHRMRTLRRIEKTRAEIPPSPIDPTRCKRGHVRTAENTRIKTRKSGAKARECRECERARFAEKAAREGRSYKPRKPRRDSPEL